MKLKRNMSSQDIKLVINEISDLVQDYSIDNIYELNDIYVFRLKGFKPGSKRQISILVEIGKRIHLTEFKREFPERPSPKCLSFRKFLKNGKIKQLIQLGLDRIVLLEVENLETNKLYTIIIELFGKGNIILIENIKGEDGERTTNKVIYALWYRIMRDRTLLAGREFIFPPTRGKSLLDATSDDLTQVEGAKNEQIVKVLVKNFGISGEVVEEILNLVDIDKTTNFTEIIPENNEKIILGINRFKKNVEKGPPLILGDENKIPFTVLPYLFKSVKGEPIGSYSNFNEACDQYFSTNELALESKDELVYINKIKQYNKMLEKQLSHVETLKKTADEKKRLGTSITNSAYLIDDLFNTIHNANKKGIHWDEISNKINIGKQKGISSALLFETLNHKNKEITINLDGEIVSLDFTKKAFDIANKYFEQSKKAEGKIKPALEVIGNIRKTIEEFQEQKDQATAIKNAKAVKKRAKKWFEQYHWTVSSTGKLIIAGRNAKMNEQLVRRRLENNDMFFHADVQGAPYTILKEEKVEIKNFNQVDLENDSTNTGFSINDLNEAAYIAGCYSKAWKSGVGSINVYAVPPSQISFSAPSGEYLPKGGIIVSGKRNYYTVSMQLYIGVYFDEIYAYLFVSGSENTIKRYSRVYTVMNNSNTTQKKSDVARKIQSYFEKTISDEESKNKLRTLTINDYVMKIP